MGGKIKQSQRTKNNARPSSSGRSAGLLTTGVAGGGLFSSLSLTNELPLPSELALVFKKLHKKDPITKTKALQELSELAANTKVEDLELALPLWTHHYRALAHDNDRRVRELTQQCQHAVVLGAGRRVAPFIKRLLPTWLPAAHDPHIPAAHRARAALDGTFPGHKLNDALMYCRDDIMAGLVDTLQTPLPQCTKEKNEDDEEALAASCRRVICAMGALGELIQTSQGDKQWLDENALPIVNNAVFWKLLQHPNECVRGAWYACCVRWCPLGAPLGPRLLRALIAHKETGAANAQRWAALLTLITCHADWSKWLDKPELLVTRIVGLLETGGWGDARRLRGLMVPLLKLLPAAQRTDHFYTRYFHAAFKGLESKSIQHTKAEREAWSDMIAETLQLATDDHQAVVAVCAWVRQWLVLALNHKAASSLIVTTGRCLTSLVRHWFRHQTVESDRVVWLNIATVHPLHEQPSSEESPASPHERPPNLTAAVAAIERHALLLKSMHDSFYEKPKSGKKKKTLTFADDKLDESSDVTIDSTVENDSGDKAETDTSITEEEAKLLESVRVRFELGLDEATAAVTAHWLQWGEQSRALSAILPAVLALTAPRDSIALWRAVALAMGADDIYQLYRKKLFPWLRDEKLACEELVTLVFRVMRHLDQPRQGDVYVMFDQCDDTVVQWVVAKVSKLADAGLLSDPPYSDCWSRWLQGPRAGAALTAAMCAMCYGEPVHMAPASVLLMHAHTLPTIASCVSSALAGINKVIMEHSHMDVDSHSQSSDGDDNDHRYKTDDELSAVTARLGPVLGLCAVLGHALETRGLCHQYTDVVIAIFTTLLYTPRGMPGACRAAALEAVSTLHARLTAHARHTVETHLNDLVRRFLYDSADISLRNVHHAASVTSLLARTSLPPPPPPPARATSPHPCLSLTPELCERLDAVMTSLRPPQRHACDIITHALRADVVNGRLSCPVASDSDTHNIKRVIEESKTNEVSEVSKEVLIQYLKDLTFRAYLIKRAVSKGNYDDANDSDDDITANRREVAANDDVTVNRCEVATNDDVTVNRCEVAANDDVTANQREVAANDDVTANRLEVATNDDVTVNRGDVAEDDVNKVKSATTSLHEMALEDTEDDMPQCNLIQNEAEEWVVNQSLQLIHDKTVLDSLRVYCGYWSHYDTLTLCAMRVTSLCDVITASLPLRLRVEQRRRLHARASAEGYYWSCAAAAAARTPHAPPVTQTHGYFHSLQAHGRLSTDEGLRLSAAYAVVARAVHTALYAGRKDPAVGQPDPAVGRHDPAAGHADPVVVHSKRAVGHSDSVEGHADPAFAFAQQATRADNCEEERTDAIMKVYYEHPHVFYIQHETPSSPPPLPSWEAACAGAALGDYLRTLLALRGWLLPPAHIDLTTLALAALMEAVGPHIAHIHNTKMAMLCVSTLRLYSAVQAFISDIRPRSLRQQPSPHVNALPREWEDLFRPSLAPRVNALRLTMLESREPLTSNHVSVMAALSQCRVQGLSPTERTQLLEAAAARMAVYESTALQTFAAIIIIDMSKDLANDDEEALAKWSLLADDEDPDAANARPLLHAARLAPLALTAVTRALDDPTEVLAARAALLLAETLHHIATATDHVDRHSHYIHIYKEHDYIQPLVELCLHLLPRDVIKYAHGISTPTPTSGLRRFTHPPALSVTDHVTMESVRALACRALYTSLGGPGGVRARAWYGGSTPQTRRVLERVTRAYIAPSLIKAAVDDVVAHQDDIEDATVRAYTAGGEVVLALEVDFRTIELQVTMSPLHPLCPMRLSGLGVGTAPQWLSVLVARSPWLRHALRLWARAVTRRVDNANTCYVCYCRLHHATGRLPNSSCRQCHNKFHYQCIRKWFLTSKNSTCPLCRGTY